MSQVILTHRCHIQSCQKLTNLQCSSCKTVYYCGRKHQKQDWKTHKLVCGKQLLSSQNLSQIDSKSSSLTSKNVTLQQRRKIDNNISNYRKEIEGKVIRLIANAIDITDLSKVTLEKSLTDDLGADEIEVIEILMGVEVEFDLKFCNDEEKKLSTVSDIVKSIAKHKQIND